MKLRDIINEIKVHKPGKIQLKKTGFHYMFDIGDKHITGIELINRLGKYAVRTYMHTDEDKIELIKSTLRNYRINFKEKEKNNYTYFDIIDPEKYFLFGD